MRIMSDFRDYYDCIQGMGVDQSVVWERKTRDLTYEESFEHNPFHQCVAYLRGRIGLKGVLIFCGKAHLLFTRDDLYKNTRDTRLQDLTMRLERLPEDWWDVFPKLEKGVTNRTYPDLFSTLDTLKRLKEMDHTTINVQFRSPIVFLSNDRDTLNSLNAHIRDPRHWHFDWYWSYYSGKSCVNPNLQEMDFQKVYDAYIAYQEISMFMSNALVTPKEIDTISEGVRLEKRGFDRKKSFRKEKAQKK